MRAVIGFFLVLLCFADFSVHAAVLLDDVMRGFLAVEAARHRLKKAGSEADRMIAEIINNPELATVKAAKAHIRAAERYLSKARVPHFNRPEAVGAVVDIEKQLSLFEKSYERFVQDVKKKQEACVCRRPPAELVEEPAEEKLEKPARKPVRNTRKHLRVSSRLSHRPRKPKPKPVKVAKLEVPKEKPRSKLLRKVSEPTLPKGVNVPGCFEALVAGVYEKPSGAFGALKKLDGLGIRAGVVKKNGKYLVCTCAHTPGEAKRYRDVVIKLWR